LILKIFSWQKTNGAPCWSKISKVGANAKTLRRQDRTSWPAHTKAWPAADDASDGSDMRPHRIAASPGPREHAPGNYLARHPVHQVGARIHTEHWSVALTD
jgi:hypothetical protein